MNNFEKLLGKNGELVEERKKQVLAGALGIVQRYYKETPNKMEAVATLFGKKLGEEFAVKSSRWRYVVLCRFAKDGLWLKAEGGFWVFNQPWLVFLLTGQVEIVED